MEYTRGPIIHNRTTLDIYFERLWSKRRGLTWAFKPSVGDRPLKTTDSLE